LIRLLLDYVCRMIELSIDKLLILDIDKRRKVKDGRAYERETPERYNFHKPVCNEGREECLASILRYSSLQM